MHLWGFQNSGTTRNQEVGKIKAGQTGRVQNPADSNISENPVCNIKSRQGSNNKANRHNDFMVLAYLRFSPYPISLMVHQLDFSCAPRQGFSLLCQLLLSPGILPGRLISSSFPPLGVTSCVHEYWACSLLVVSGFCYCNLFHQLSGLQLSLL